MSDKVRVYEIAEEAGASSSEVIEKAKDLGIDLKNHQSAVSFEDAEEITNYIMTGRSSRLPKVNKKKKTISTARLINNEKVNSFDIKHTNYKAIPRDKVKIVAKGYQRDIVLIKEVEKKESNLGIDLQRDFFSNNI